MPTAPSPQPNMQPVPVVASTHRLPERTIYNWVKAKKLPSRRGPDGVTLVDMDVAGVLAASRAAGTTAIPGGVAAHGTTGLDGETTAILIEAFSRGEKPLDVAQRLRLPAPVILEALRQYEELRNAGGAGQPSLAERVSKLAEEVKSLWEALDQRTWNGSMGDQVGGLQLQVAQIEQRLAALPVPSRDTYSCEFCGAKGWVASHVRCTACGSDTKFGFYPPKR